MKWTSDSGRPTRRRSWEWWVPPNHPSVTLRSFPHWSQCHCPAYLWVMDAVMHLPPSWMMFYVLAASFDAAVAPGQTWQSKSRWLCQELQMLNVLISADIVDILISTVSSLAGRGRKSKNGFYCWTTCIWIKWFSLLETWMMTHAPSTAWSFQTSIRFSFFQNSYVRVGKRHVSGTRFTATV